MFLCRIGRRRFPERIHTVVWDWQTDGTHSRTTWKDWIAYGLHTTEV